MQPTEGHRMHKQINTPALWQSADDFSQLFLESHLEQPVRETNIILIAFSHTKSQGISDTKQKEIQRFA